MKGIKFLIISVLFLAMAIGGFSYLIIEQERVLKSYFVEEPKRRVEEFSESLANSLGRYFMRETKNSGLEEVADYIKIYGRGSLFDLLFVFKDQDGSLKQISKDGVTAVSGKVLGNKWVYPVSIDRGVLEGYLIVMIKDAGETEVKEGLQKYIAISYSLRFLFLLLIVSLFAIFVYHNYSAKMKLARDLAEIKASNDGLTGLHTHAYFIKSLGIEMEKFRIYKTPVALLMLDIDYFKKFNDQYGHPAGDKILEEVASIIKANTRATDIPARYGGEEFSVIVPYVAKSNEVTDRRKRLEMFTAEIKNVAERIRKSVEDHNVQFQSLNLHVTVSIGVAYCYGRAADTANGARLLEKADKALYEAKKLGRNRISIDYKS